MASAETLTPTLTNFLLTRAEDAVVLRTGSIRHLDHEVLMDYQTAYRTLVDGSYFANPWCPSCNFEMITRVWAAVRDQQPELFGELTADAGEATAAPEVPEVPEQPQPAEPATGKGRKK